MTNQLKHTKPNNWWDKLLAKQQFECVVDAPPRECANRLSYASICNNAGASAINVLATDEEETYVFEVALKEDVRGLKFTRSKCEGIIVAAAIAGQSHVSYSSERSVSLLLWVAFWIGMFISTFTGIPNTTARIGIACVAYLVFWASLSDFSKDRDLGLRVYGVLTSPPPPAAKPR